MNNSQKRDLHYSWGKYAPKLHLGLYIDDEWRKEKLEEMDIVFPVSSLRSNNEALFQNKEDQKSKYSQRFTDIGLYQILYPKTQGKSIEQTLELEGAKFKNKSMNLR